MIIKNGKRLDVGLDTLPIGTIQPFVGEEAPSGYLLCQGQLISKSIYSELYKVCGNRFGSETDTHFYLPDLRGKTIAGYDADNMEMNNIGKLLGAAEHSHTSAAHTHTVAGHTHTSAAHTHSTGNHTLTTSEIPSHNHNGTTDWGGAHKHAFGDWANWLALGGEQNIIEAGNSAAYTSEAGSHQHTFTTNYTGGSGAHNHGNTGSTTPGNTGSTSLTSDSTTPGATGSNSNFQPTVVMNWIIKAYTVSTQPTGLYNGLNSTSTKDALTAAQGKVLNDILTSQGEGISVLSNNQDAFANSINSLQQSVSDLDKRNSLTSTETYIGKWIDGRDLYSQTCYGMCPTQNVATWQNLFYFKPDGLVDVVDISGVIRNTASDLRVIPINSYESSSYYACFSYLPTINYMQCMGVGWFSNAYKFQYVITIKYTKSS